MAKPVPCPDAEAALCQAMQRAVETLSEPGTLTDARFGRFADLNAGWHWTLEISREVTSEHPHLQDRTDTLTRRIALVVHSWRTAVGKYEGEGNGASHSQG